eukprot:TRINITY_DN40508_c0_g1_i1.p1 TRINITY_DN40508_c0_g1~~TRINITY_DN40508_c0_g1_i1.p1  ORF type:complete len:176 (-),score=21.44 TRINITY_DN40508_c0_g1_i1:173-700(-)
MAATLVSHPMDTLRVRVSVDTSRDGIRYHVLARSVWETEGIRGLYRGLLPTLWGAGPRVAVGFSIFETLKNEYGGELRDSSPRLHKFLCGYVAGFWAEFAVYPLDTIRRRLQASGRKSEVAALGTLQGIAHIWRNEGLARGVFKGISMNLLKGPVATAVSFSVNDLVKEALGYTY